MSTWSVHMTGVSDSVHVPPAATLINTPLVHSNWQALLAAHPDKSLVEFFIAGITNGFRIGYNHPKEPLRPAKKNMYCATQHSDVVDKYLSEEISQRRVAGPFLPLLIPRAHISRFSIIPKHHQPNKWRLIVDLSHPSGHSINDGIPKELSSLTYIAIDTSIVRANTDAWQRFIASKNRHKERFSFASSTSGRPSLTSHEMEKTALCRCMSPIWIALHTKTV